MLDMGGIRKDFADALRTSCSENQCKLGLADLSERVILKGEKLYQDRKMCDCIVFVVRDSIVVGIVELKSKTMHANEIKEKLENSSEIALDIVEKYSANRTKYRLHHLVLSKSTRKFELERMKKGIKVRERKYYIRFKRCGSPFSNVVSE